MPRPERAGSAREALRRCRLADGGPGACARPRRSSPGASSSEVAAVEVAGAVETWAPALHRQHAGAGGTLQRLGAAHAREPAVKIHRPLRSPPCAGGRPQKVRRCLDDALGDPRARRHLPYIISPLRSNSLKWSPFAQCGTRFSWRSHAVRRRECGTPTGLPDGSKRFFVQATQAADLVETLPVARRAVPP